MSHRIYSIVTDELRDSEVFKPSEATLLSTVQLDWADWPLNPGELPLPAKH